MVPLPSVCPGLGALRVLNAPESSVWGSAGMAANGASVPPSAPALALWVLPLGQSTVCGSGPQCCD